MHQHRRSVLLAASVLVSCASHRELPGGEAKTGQLCARSVLRAIPGIAARLDAGSPLHGVAAGHQLTSSPTHWSAGDDLDVTLPPTARGALRIARPSAKDAWIVVRSEDPIDRSAVVDGTSLVFAAANVDTDVVHLVTPKRTEELRLLRSPRAKTDARYRLERGPGVSGFRIVARRLEAFDASGRTLFATEPAWARDVRGSEREVRIALEQENGGDVLVTSLDARGMQFPVVVDPAWIAGPLDASAARTGVATATDGASTYFLGGSSTGTDSLSSVTYYDGTTLRALASMNTPRRGAAAFWVYSSTAGVPAKLIVAGGINGTTALSSIEYYQVGDTSWTYATASLGSPRAHMTAGGVPGIVAGVSQYVTMFLVGGNNGANTLSSIDFLQNSASGAAGVTVFPGKPLATPREGAAAVDAGGRMLIVGGRNGTTALSTAEQSSNPLTTDFASGPSLASARTDASTIGVALYGGSDGVTPLSTSEYYDGSTGTWKLGPTMSTRRMWGMGGVLYDPLAPASDGQLVLAGGWDGTSVLSTSEIITVSPYSNFLPKGSFRSGGAMPGPRAGGASLRLTAYSFLVAGGYSGSPASPTMLSTSAKFEVKVDGAVCIDGFDCFSGFCADGVCCATACTGQCATCNGSGTKGTCTAVTGAPVGGRAACDGTGAGTVCGKTCTGSDVTKCNYVGTPVCGTNTCADGVETHVSTCDGAGKCNDIPKNCGTYVCGSAACKTTCGGDPDCTAGFYCVGTNCVAKPGLGAPCSVSTPCNSGFTCVESVCCNTPCTGQCQSCAVAGSIGTCTTIKGDPLGGRAACSDGAGDACKARSCDGVDGTKCAAFKFDATKSCGAATCAGDQLVAESKCNGAGACVAPPNTACAGGFVCSAGACKTKCTTSADCVAGLQCKGTLCVPLDGLGTPCESSAGCASGFCVDATCCDKPCSGQCESCSEAGKAGTCTAVSGAPRGSRTACDDGGGEVCKARACDGTDGAKCAAFANGSTRTCAEPKCAGGNAVGEGKCDGTGACKAGESKSCAPYQCVEGGTTCRTDCTTATQCALGNDCIGGVCQPGTGAKCDETNVVSIAKDGSRKECKPYRCRGDGLCDDKCVTSSDCQNGYVCDTNSARCIESAPPAEDSGGCALGGTSETSASPWSLLSAVAVAVVVGARRRRARGSRVTHARR